MGFANALFLVGMAAAAIPLIIHLIHRRRAPRVPFSTLRFLMASHRRTARRRRLHNLLILALRMAMMALVAVACAGPFLRSDLFGSAGAGGGVAIVLDNSLSMSAREQGGSRYDLAKEAAESILGQLGERDLAAVLPAAPVAAAEEPPRLTNDVEELRNRIATSEPAPSAADLVRAIGRAERLLREAGFARREIYVLTDMQARSWEGAAEEGGRAGGERVPVVVLDCSATEVRNVGIGQVKVLAQAMVAGAPLTVRATVRNGTPRNEEAVVDLFLEEEKRGTRSLTLGPHEAKPVEFTFSIREPGTYRGRLSLRGDNLPGDDVAYFTVGLTAAVPVLLVKESVHPIDFLDDTFFLSRALNPFAGEEAASPTGIEPEEVLLPQVTEERLRRYPVTFLVNVGSLGEEQAAMFRRYVAAGNGLVVFLGPRVKAERYNRLLGETGAGGPGLLPAVLSEPRGDAEGRTRFFRLEPAAEEHPLFSPFRGGVSEFFSQVHVYRFFPVKVPAGAGGRVLAWLGGAAAERRPFLVEGTCGQGRCLLVVTPPTASWSNLPVTPLFLPLVSTAVHYLAGEARQVAPLRPGVPKRFFFPTAEGPVSVEVTDPAGRTTRLSGQAGTQELLYRDTYQVGVYRYTVAGPTPRTGYFAVNPEPEESDLRRADPDALAERFPRFAFHLARSPAELDTVMARLHQPYQLSTIFFWLLLVVAAAEGILANLVSAQRGDSKESTR